MNYLDEIIVHIELHNATGIINCFANGVNSNDLYNGIPLIYELTSEYTRSPDFKECVKIFTSHGLQFADKALLAVLMDNAELLQEQINIDKSIVFKTYSLRCAYTPLHKVTLLHICAEFNHLQCAKLLVKFGANINAKAGMDEFGFGGQTPIFHTVNQNGNQSAAMMEYLLSLKADLEITITGLIWGKGYEWETFIPAVNPLSYAMMGLLPQMHRDESTTANIVAVLLKHKNNIEYSPQNIPNKYLSK
jgi:Ankyrin repeat